MQKRFQYQSANISYQMIGTGQPLVLLHGFGEDSRIWQKQIEFLQTVFLLIIPDLPGSGNSDILHANSSVLQEPIQISDYTDCIYALLQEENILQCTLLGHSMGGYITLSFAEKYPESLHAFGLIHSTAYADSEEKKKTREKGIDFISTHGSFAFLKTSIPNLFSAGFRENQPEKINAFIESGSYFTKESLCQYYMAMKLRSDKTSVLKDNPLPVLFVTGTEDMAAPMPDILEQAKLPVKSYIHVLSGVGHMSMMEAPELLNRFIIRFMDR